MIKVGYNNGIVKIETNCKNDVEMTAECVALVSNLIMDIAKHSDMHSPADICLLCVGEVYDIMTR